MLVLTRKILQSIEIGEGDDLVRVTVVKIEGGQVRIGIEARRGIPVVRTEVRERLEREAAEEVRVRGSVSE